MIDVQKEYNRRMLRQRPQPTTDQLAARQLAARKRQEEDLAAVRAIQWRTKAAAIERRMSEVSFNLRLLPGDPDLQDDAAALEAIYREHLGIKPASLS